MAKRIIFLFFLIVSFLFGLKANAENVRFVQITDSHVSVNSEYSMNVLKSAVADINTLEGVSFVVFTGNNINNPTEDNLKAFLNIVRKLNVPYYIALGNHDVYKAGGLSKARYFEIIRESNPIYPQRRPNYSFKKNGFLFFVVDGAKEILPSSSGYYREDTLKWLSKELDKNDKNDVVIFQHFPIEYPLGGDVAVKTNQTYKVEEYRTLLNQYDNILAVISGHFHVNSENMKNGVYHITSPSLLTLPQSYKIIDIVTTKEFSPIIYSQLRSFKIKD